MKINVEVVLNSTKFIEQRLGINTGGRANLFLANESARRMFKYVPYRSGMLRTVVSITALWIEYLVKYARRQYYENRGSGIRGSFWDKRMMSAEGSALIKDVQRYIYGG